MKSFPIHPDHMSFKELAAWGEDHQDLWVKQLARFAKSYSYYVPEEYSDPDDYFDYVDTKIHDLERDAEYAQEEEQLARRETEEWKEKYDALRLEFNMREEAYTITHLKARISVLYDDIAQKDKQRQIDAEYHACVVSELGKLKKRYDELHEKYNVFTIIAT